VDANERCVGKYQHFGHITLYHWLQKGFANGIFMRNFSTFISHNQQHLQKIQPDTRPFSSP
jgi:hypothetical protein